MKPEGALRHFLLAFLLALACYALLYKFIEDRRTQKGPWQITFAVNDDGYPLMVVDHPSLAITNVQIAFAGEQAPPTNALGKLVFSQPQPVPYPVPFGQCVFMDTTFLPGSVAFRLYGHAIELLPRALIVDGQEHPWFPTPDLTLHPLVESRSSGAGGPPR